MTDWVRADTGDLRHFVESGESYVDQLVSVFEDVAAARLQATSAVGGGAADISSAPFQELIGEAIRSNSYVDEVRRALGVFGIALESAVESRLERAGFSGTDHSAEDDLALAIETAWRTGDEELVTSLLLMQAVNNGTLNDEQAYALQTSPPELVAGVVSGQLSAEEATTIELPTEDLQAIRGWLGDDWRGVTQHDLNRIRDRLADTDGWEADWILAQLSNREIETLIDNVESSGWSSDDWSEGTQNAFYVMMGEKVSFRSWWRLGEHTEAINPDPSTAISDSARDNPDSLAMFDRLEYRVFDGPLASEPGLPGGAIGPSVEHPFGMDDMNQGGIGDCYFIAAMIALADNDPSALEGMIHPNPNGTYTVTFADGSKQVVTPDFPVDPNRPRRGPAFANPGPGAEGDEIWFMVLEKAYAQEAGSWGSIVGGRQSTAIEDLTGLDSGWIDDSDIDITNLAERFDNGEILGLSTIDKPDDTELDDWRDDPNTPDTFKFTGTDGKTPPRLYQNHAYVVVGVDGEAGTISVINPWTPEMTPIVLTEAELIEGVNGVYQNDAPD